MGYIGYSESERSAYAKENGEWPISHCKRILKEQSGIAFDTGFLDLRFEPSSWHHTSKNYNRTDFYKVEEMIDSIVNDNLIDDYIEYMERNGTKLNVKIIKTKEKEFLEKFEAYEVFCDDITSMPHGYLKCLTLTDFEGNIEKIGDSRVLTVDDVKERLSELQEITGLNTNQIYEKFKELDNDSRKNLFGSLGNFSHIEWADPQLKTQHYKDLYQKTIDCISQHFDISDRTPEPEAKRNKLKI